MFYRNNFAFSHTIRTGKHYYDNRGGAPMYYVAYLISGEVRYVAEGETHHARAGQIVYLPKGYRYQSFWSGENIDSVIFGFFDAGTRENLKNTPQIFNADEELIALFLSVRIEPSQSVTYRSISLLYAVLERISAQITQDGGRDDRIIKQAKIYIAQNTNASIPEIAAACGISESYFYVICRRAGTTPNALKQHLLCEMAADLLTSTDLRVEEIAERLGFSSDNYFRKIFKKHMGQSPLAIRKNALI